MEKKIWAQLDKTDNVVKETLKFQMYHIQELLPYFADKKVRIFCSAKNPYNFSAKNTATIDFVSTFRLKESLTKDFLKQNML